MRQKCSEEQRVEWEREAGRAEKMRSGKSWLTTRSTKFPLVKDRNEVSDQTDILWDMKKAFSKDGRGQKKTNPGGIKQRRKTRQLQRKPQPRSTLSFLRKCLKVFNRTDISVFEHIMLEINCKTQTGPITQMNKRQDSKGIHDEARDYNPRPPLRSSSPCLSAVSVFPSLQRGITENVKGHRILSGSRSAHSKTERGHTRFE